MKHEFSCYNVLGFGQAVLLQLLERETRREKVLVYRRYSSLHLSVQVLEAIHREKILVQKKRQGRGFRGVFGKVQTYIMYVFSIYDLQVQRLGMETFRSLATKETEAEQQV